MARLWQDGFEHGVTTSGGLAVTGSPTINTTTVNGGSYALEIKSLVSGSLQSVAAALTGSGSIRYFRFYLNVVTRPSASNAIFQSSNAVGTSIIKLNSDGSLGLWDTSSTQVGSNSPVLSLNTWYCIELHQDFTNAAGSRTLEARINGGATFASTTTAQITTTATNPRYGGNLLSEAQTQGDWLFDDLAVNDGSGTAGTSWCGPGLTIVLPVNAAGDNAAWSIQTGGTAGTANNFSRVDELAPDGATTFNGSNTLNQTDDYNCADTPAALNAGSTINFVAVGIYFAGAGSANASFKVRCKKTSGGTISTSGSNSTPAGTAYVYNGPSVRNFPLILSADPDGSAWTKSTLDSMQVGMIVTATNTHASNVSTIWASVDYIPGPIGEALVMCQAVNRSNVF